MRSACPQRALVLAVFFWFALGIFFVKNGIAWGAQPHEIIGEISHSFLFSKVRKKIRSEFNIKYFASIANWADRVKKDKNENRWHYTNIPKGELVYDRLRDCPDGECVTEKIGDFVRGFREQGYSQREKQDALKYLVHFVADIHQPLHAGNLEDRGGNDIPVRFHDERTNLHALWDHGLFPKADRSSAMYAKLLACKPESGDEFTLPDIPVVKWTNESRRLAVEHAYALALSEVGQVSPEYVRASREIMDRQMCRAGIRLANLINQLLSGN